jgi:tetratricopeptide (TPR) repeat protein
VISLRKPGLLSSDKAEQDYLVAVKDTFFSEDVKRKFIEDVVYLSGAGYEKAADSLISGLASDGKDNIYYREAGEYALKSGRPSIAYMFFSKYLAAVYDSEGRDKCAAESKRLEDLFRGGYPYYSGRLEIIRLKIALDNASDQSEILGFIRDKAAALYRQGSTSESIELYELAYNSSRDVNILLTVGNIYLESGKYESALRKYREYPDADGNPEVLFKMALCDRKMGENSAAYSLFKRIELQFKDSDYYDDALYYMGTLNREAGLLEESEKYFEKLRSEKPGSEYLIRE